MTEEKRMRDKRSKERKKRDRQLRMRLVIATDLFLLAAIVLVGGLLFVRWYREKNRPVLSEVVAPDWHTQDFLDENQGSRTGRKRKKINNIVIHYVANEKSTAKNNRDFFNNMEANDRQVSAHYIVGLEGEVIQCIPLDEVANANAPRNEDTVSIEVCHPDSTGEFSDITKASLYRLTSWLCKELNLTERDIIRHFDITGKNCPKFYVEDEGAWKSLKEEMKKKRKES